MESSNRAIYRQIAIQFITKLLNSLISKRYNKNLRWFNSFFLHQIFNFCRNCSGFARTRTSNNKTIILIRQNNTTLIFIQFDLRINFTKNIIQIMLFLDHRTTDKRFIMLVNKGFKVYIF